MREKGISWPSQCRSTDRELPGPALFDFVCLWPLGRASGCLWSGSLWSRGTRDVGGPEPEGKMVGEGDGIVSVMSESRMSSSLSSCLVALTISFVPQSRFLSLQNWQLCVGSVKSHCLSVTHVTKEHSAIKASTRLAFLYSHCSKSPITFTVKTGDGIGGHVRKYALSAGFAGGGCGDAKLKGARLERFTRNFLGERKFSRTEVSIAVPWTI